MSNIQTPEFRVSFPQVFKPKAPPRSDKEKYSVQMLFTIADIKADPVQKRKWKELKAAIEAAKQTKWGDNLPKKTWKEPFRNGAEKDFDGYGEGVFFINATTTTKPGLVNENLNDIISVEDFYPGCYAHATVNAYAWEFMDKYGVSLGLQNIQKTRDGDPLGVGRISANEEFQALEPAVVLDDNDEDLFGDMLS